MSGDFPVPRTWAFPVSVAAALVSAFVLVLEPILAIVPLGAFVLFSLTAPFLPRLSFFLPVVTRGRGGRNEVTLSFDDGPAPGTTTRLLDLLREHGAPAVFFVTGKRALENPDLLAAIREDGHEIGNHTHNHDPLLMLRRRSTIAAEIDACARVLEDSGVRSPFFRPPAGITGPRLGPVLGKRGLLCVNFACRAADWGNRRPRGLARAILGKVRPGHIVLLHDAPPGDGFTVTQWLAEIEALLVGLRERGTRIVSLATLLNPGPKAVD